MTFKLTANQIRIALFDYVCSHYHELYGDWDIEVIAGENILSATITDELEDAE